MTYSEFCRRAAGWTDAQLRFDVRPSAALLAFMEEVGPERYERYVLRLVKGGAGARGCR